MTAVRRALLLLVLCMVEVVLLLLQAFTAPGTPPTTVASTGAAHPVLQRHPAFSDIYYTATARLIWRGQLGLTAAQKTAIVDALQRYGNPRRTYEGFLVLLVRTLQPAQMEILKRTLLTRVPIETLPPIEVPQSDAPFNATWIQTLIWMSKSTGVSPQAVHPSLSPADTTSEALSGIPSLPQHWILSLNYALRSGQLSLSRSQTRTLLPALAAAVEADRTEARLRQTIDGILEPAQRDLIVNELQASEVNGLVIMDESGPRVADADQFLAFLTTPVTASTSRAQ